MIEHIPDRRAQIISVMLDNGSIRKILTGPRRSATEGLWRIEWPGDRHVKHQLRNMQSRGNTKKLSLICSTLSSSLCLLCACSLSFLCMC